MNRTSGFTLIELIVVVALVAILTVIATPPLQSMVRNNRAAAQANQLVSALHIARSEAITRGASISLCARADSGSGCSSGRADWTQGWLVFSDFAGTGSYSSPQDEVLQVFPPLSSDSTLEPQQGSQIITFGAGGFLDPAVHASGVTFALGVSGCTGNENRQIEINLQGRTSMNRQPCS